MTSLYNRASPRQKLILRMVEGAVRNAVAAHPGWAWPTDQKFARSIAKRAAGTLTAQWAVVLAASPVEPLGGTSDSGGGFTRPTAATAAGHLLTGGDRSCQRHTATAGRGLSGQGRAPGSPSYGTEA